MKFLKIALILFIGALSYSCSEDAFVPHTEDEEDPIIIGDPDEPLPGYPTEQEDTVWTA